MENFIIIAVVAVILAFAVGYIIKQKKKGVKCVGCPHAKECALKNCNCESETKN